MGGREGEEYNVKCVGEGEMGTKKKNATGAVVGKWVMQVRRKGSSEIRERYRKKPASKGKGGVEKQTQTIRRGCVRGVTRQSRA